MDVEDTFGTIFHSELMSIINLGENTANAAKLLDTLKRMEETRIRTVMYSVSWEYIAPEENKIRWDYIDLLAGTACQNTKLKVALIMDLLHPPAWVLRKFPNASAMDAGGRRYDNNLSWFHGPANVVAREALRSVAQHLSSKHPGCAVAMQPVYNNEYEAKYTQEYDSYQDYGPHALDAYRAWLRSRRAHVSELNQRWGSSYASWAEVAPPPLVSGALMGLAEDTQYWDWMRFRVEFGAEHFNAACRVVQEAGLKCYHHFPEFFSVLDAIYGASMFNRIAASPYTDFVIMDSNFRTPYGTLMNPSKLRLYVAAAQSYGKPIYFEAAVERFAQMGLLRDGFRASRLAGAANLGITNWLTRVEMNSSLADAMYEPLPNCKVEEVVGVFIHLDSCSAWQGMQWHASRKDPLHDFIEDLAAHLAERCGTDIAVFTELDRFVAALPSLSRAVFVEPLVLYGSKELTSYVAAKAGMARLPHATLTLPSNSSRGLALRVIQDL